MTPDNRMDLAQSLQAALQVTPVRLTPLHGGCVAQVFRVALPEENAYGKSTVVVKYDPSPDACLDIEGNMLAYLAEHTSLPVPRVYYPSKNLLVMEDLPGDNHFSVQAQHHAGQLIARLHQCTYPRYGFPFDTLIGGLPQPNPPTDSWVEFFREHRILLMARRAHREGSLPPDLLNRLERFAERLESWLCEPERPALLHGDLWGGNILADEQQITGLVDPALYFGHPEIELAFATLFGTFGEPFFRSYQEISPIAPGFFEIRRDLYNLYPQLVHVRLFGSAYLAGIDQTLRRLGI